MKNHLLYLTIVLTIIFYGITGYHFLTGWHPIIMMCIAICIGLLINLIIYVLLILIGKGLQGIPLKSTTAVLSTIGVLIIIKYIGFGWPTVFYSAIIALGIAFCIALYAYQLKRNLF